MIENIPSNNVAAVTICLKNRPKKVRLETSV